MTSRDSDSKVEDTLTSIQRLVKKDIEASRGKASEDILLLEPEARVQSNVLPQEHEAPHEMGTLLLGAQHKGEAPMLMNAVEEDVAEFDLEPLLLTEVVNNSPTQEIPQKTSQSGEATPSADPTKSVDFQHKLAALEKIVGFEAPEKTETSEDHLEQEAQSHIDEDSLADASDDFLAEEDLNDMIRELLLKELQGELGERVTQSVRKLVRREIYRALSAQGLL